MVTTKTSKTARTSSTKGEGGAQRSGYRHCACTRSAVRVSPMVLT